MSANPVKATVVIVGASGFLGRQLVPLLVEAGYPLLLCGRDPDALATHFPGKSVCAIETLADHVGHGPHALLHLAVMNSNQSGSEATFFEANVTYLKDVLDHARAAGVGQIIYPSSFHVTRDPKTPYAKSKAAAEYVIASCTNLRTTILKLPVVYGVTFQGRLAGLNWIPKPLRRLAFLALRSLRSTAHVHLVFEAIHAALGGAGGPLQIVADNQDDNWVYRLCKRLIDLSFVLFITIFFWWLLLLIWATVRLTSNGPGLFLQERVGRNGVIFRCVKFRTMLVGTKHVGTHDVPKHAITRIGAVLRRLRLDELPQIWNILIGEMSLVGPRPCLPMQTDLIAARTRCQVFDLRPGITGLAQVNRIDMSTPETLAKIDAIYEKKQTIIMDIKIILATLPGISAPVDIQIDAQNLGA